jgi:hypothetical protein
MGPLGSLCRVLRACVTHLGAGALGAERRVARQRNREKAKPFYTQVLLEYCKLVDREALLLGITVAQRMVWARSFPNKYTSGVGSSSKPEVWVGICPKQLGQVVVGRLFSTKSRPFGYKRWDSVFSRCADNL